MFDVVYIHDDDEREREKPRERTKSFACQDTFVFFIKTEFVLVRYRQQKKTMFDIWHTQWRNIDDNTKLETLHAKKEEEEEEEEMKFKHRFLRSNLRQHSPYMVSMDEMQRHV